MISPEYNTIIPTALTMEKGRGELDYEAISYFVSAGFFFENDTYWKSSKWNNLNFDEQPWEYAPRKISLDQAVKEFADLFHQVVDEQTHNAKVILPLSGGLDSRTLAVALKNLGKQPYSYSYRFEGSFEETKFGQQIANKLGWEFDALVIPPGYLWSKIEKSGRQNACYAEFTHARQIAVAEEISKKGNTWLLGHWGDVLFDDMGVKSDLSFEEQKVILQKKVLKKGGKELASDLWRAWGLKGDFEDALSGRIDKMHGRIDIDDANARIRAFKSLYWATRWTSTNLKYFSDQKPIALPYYDDRLCKFIMKMPEEYLKGRQIQIEYIKKYNPELAKIEWQAKSPYNLYNHHKHLTSSHLAHRISKKAKSVFKEKLLNKQLIQRNWEIQFLGENNDKQLRHWLFENESFSALVPLEVTKKYYDLFKTGDKVYWSHPVSMLLTLSVFAKQNQIGG